MTIDREKLYTKVRALLAKTQDNGCTEAEAMAALAKARAMMDAYEITDDELALTKEEKAIIRASTVAHDKYGVRQWLCGGVARFTNCKTWVSKSGKFAPPGQIVFCGLPSDVQLADWLLGSLEAFVRSELVEFLMTDTTPRGMRRRIVNGFVTGCAGRISERLLALTQQSEAAAEAHGANSRALVVIKNAAIDEAMSGIRLRSRGTKRVSNAGAEEAGRAAGERATFGRPVGSGGQRLLGR